MYLKKNFIVSILITAIMAVPAVISAQDNEDKTYQDMENIADENYDYLKKINRIIKDYPNFAYSYNIEDGKVKSVAVTGVEDEYDKKRLEIYLFDLKSNKNAIKNKANRIGVFYSVDETADYTEGDEALQRTLLSNLKYPEEAKDWGVEGTIYMKFVVDENGEIPFATAAEDVNTSFPFYVDDLEKQAVSAVKATSGKWDPAEVDGVDVPSMVVVPITFEKQKNPAIRAWVR